MKKASALGTRIVREATRVDRSAIELAFAMRSTVGVAIVIGLSTVLHAPIAGAAGALGSMVVGFASRQGVYRTRATAMIATSFAMALTAFVASITNAHVFASIAVAVIFGYACGVLASLGPTATTVAVNSAVALAIFGVIKLTPAEAAYQSLFVVAGGLLQTLLLVVLWPFERFATERSVLASAFTSLADYAQSFPSIKLRSPSAATFVKLSDVFADMQPFAKRGEIVAFEVLFDETERIRGALAALATEKFLLERDGRTAAATAIGSAGTAAANVMSEIAGALSSARAPEGNRLWDDFALPRDTLAAHADTFSKRALADLDALLGQLRSAWRAAYAPSGHEPPADAPAARETRVARATSVQRPHIFPTSEIAETLATLRANLSPRSEYARHGFRLAIVLGVAVFAEHHLPIQRGYWIVLTAALVLRPDFGATYARGAARIGGTLAGAVLASLIALLHPGELALGSLTIAFAFASYLFLPINYGLFTLTITAYVVFVIGLAGAQEPSTIGNRVVSTIIGGGLALVAYVVWPTWERRYFPRRFAELLGALAEYGHGIFAAYLDPTTASDDEIHRLQLGAWLARSNAEASFDRMSAEPVKPDTLTIRASLGVLAASRRYGLALLSLSVHRPTKPLAASAQFRTLVDACEAALDVLDASIRKRRPPTNVPPLRQLHGALVDAIGTATDVESTVAAAETDLMVDALNTIARILTRRYAQPEDATRVVRSERP